MLRYADYPSKNSEDELDPSDDRRLFGEESHDKHHQLQSEQRGVVSWKQAVQQAPSNSAMASGIKSVPEYKPTTTHSEQPQGISVCLKRCMLRFKYLLENTPLDKCAQEIPVDLWQEQYRRLQGWASNIGAYAQDTSSVEFRLREASRILQHVDSLIRSVQADIADVKSYVQHVGDARQTEDAQSNSDSDSTTMLQELYTSIDSYVTDLLKVSIIIHNSTNHERILQLDSDAVAQTAPWFVRHVREKFPNCDTSVCDRLGRAIARRRAEVEYRRKQSEKRKRGLARFLGEQDYAEEKSQTPTKFTNYAEFVQSIENDIRTETTSQTGYSDLDTTNIDGGLSIPPPPRESADGKPFDCPYCFNPTIIQRPKDWPCHVLHDALPYICVIAECSTGDNLYASRREYYKHLRRGHATSLERIAGQPCLLCYEIPSETYLVHLSHHLIQLALFSIQPYDAEVDEDKEAITKTVFEDSDTASGSQGVEDIANDSDALLRRGARGTDLKTVHITNVSSTVDQSELRRLLENFGRLTSFASFYKDALTVCFEESSSAISAAAASPLKVGIEQVLIRSGAFESAMSPMDKVMAVQAIFHQVYNPKVNYYRVAAPADQVAREAAYTTLKGRILEEIVSKANDLNLEGDAEARLLRTNLVRKADAAIAVLDSTFEQTNKPGSTLISDTLSPYFITLPPMSQRESSIPEQLTGHPELSDRERRLNTQDARPLAFSGPLDADDRDPSTPDRIYARHKTSLITINLPADSISEGKAVVADLVRQVAATLQADPRLIRLFYKGTELISASSPLKAYYMKQNSEVVVQVTASEPGVDDYAEIDEGDPSNQKRSTTIAQPESAATSRRSDLTTANAIDPPALRSVEIEICSRDGIMHSEDAVFSPQARSCQISKDLVLKLGFPNDRRISLRWAVQGQSKSLKTEFEVHPGSAPSTIVLGQQALESYQAYREGAFPITQFVRSSRDESESKGSF